MRYRPYRNPIRRAFSGLYGVLWLLIVLIYFATGGHSWEIFLVGALLSVILSVVIRLITAGIIGAGPFGAASLFSNQQQQQPPYQQPYQPPQQPYQQGYQPPPVQPAQPYQEGGQVYYRPQPQYEQPQVQYPQEMPPQQQ